MIAVNKMITILECIVSYYFISRNRDVCKENGILLFILVLALSSCIVKSYDKLPLSLTVTMIFIKELFVIFLPPHMLRIFLSARVAILFLTTVMDISALFFFFFFNPTYHPSFVQVTQQVVEGADGMSVSSFVLDYCGGTIV